MKSFHFQKSKQRLPSNVARSGLAEKHQRSRSVSGTLERPRPRGRSPAFNAIASAFENPNSRNFSTPPTVGKIYPKSSLPDSTKTGPRSAAIAALTSSFETVAQSSVPQSSKGIIITKIYIHVVVVVVCKVMNCDIEFTCEARISVSRTKAEYLDKGNPSSGRLENLTLTEDSEEEVKEEEGLPTYPYECLITSSTNPIAHIDVTKREVSL